MPGRRDRPSLGSPESGDDAKPTELTPAEAEIRGKIDQLLDADRVARQTVVKKQAEGDY